MSYETVQFVLYKEVLAKRKRLERETVKAELPLWVRLAPMMAVCSGTMAIISLAWLAGLYV